MKSLLIFLLVIFPATAFAQDDWKKTYKDYEIIGTREPGASEEDGGITYSVVKILKNGVEIRKVRGHTVTIHQDFVENPFVDIDGNGVIDLALAAWSGGAHCCWTLYIFELGDEGFHIIDQIQTGSSLPSFREIDGKAGLEMIRHIEFGTPWVSFAGTAYVPFIYQATDTGYKIAPELMRKPPLKANALQYIIKTISEKHKYQKKFQYLYSYMDAYQKLPQETITSSVSYMSALLLPLLKQLFSGNAEQAWQIMDATWPGTDEEKRMFQHDLICTLQHRFSTETLEQLTHLAPEKNCDRPEWQVVH